MAIDKALYTAHATSTGGRTGSTESSDSKIKLQLSTPKELGGDSGPGTNPEQLFAAGYSACFIGAMKAVAASRRSRCRPTCRSSPTCPSARCPASPALRYRGGDGRDGAGHGPGRVEKLVAAAHEVCPYSNATRGNIDVALSVA